MSVVLTPLTLGQAVALAGLSERHFLRLCGIGEGPPRRADGGFEPADFGAWLADRHGSRTAGDRARLLTARADRAELEARQLRGELVRWPEVGAGIADRIAKLRSALLVVSDRTMSDLAHEADPRRCRAIVGSAIDAALEEFQAAMDAAAPETLTEGETRHEP